MFYTGKGDTGKTGIFGCDQKVSKSSTIIEALGTLDEINSYIGIVKSQTQENNIKEILHSIQNNLFIIQAQVAGADKKVAEEDVKKLEQIIADIEQKLSPIKTFLISGTNEVSAHFDFARTLARRAERRVVAVSEENSEKIDAMTLVYLNRLSSLLYAYARLRATDSHDNEKAPTY
jgi:cob(I)alamin adenosyltransferase